MNVLEVENVSKQYRLGLVGTGTLSHDLNRWWHRVRGKDDPYESIGEANDRSQKGDSQYVWALRDINMTVKQGEVVGIIGKNGAGKSTLLKILSRVTLPTTGVIRARGRISSLLEVGTGFHPELTGRENIFLNGAILGMRKNEIKRKLDEIIDFAGVERYIDTPVKRYSSGMYVRLAFAVAAHLEPEILIVDEVLAVGDAEFQKKCLGKMKQVSGEGRTVLFVSHNMNAVRNLCSRGLLLKHGLVQMEGGIHDIVEEYLRYDLSEFGVSDKTIVPEKWERPWGGGNETRFTKVEILDDANLVPEELLFLQKMRIRLTFETSVRITGCRFQIRISNVEGQQITRSISFNDTNELYDFDAGTHEVMVEMDPRLLPGKYTFFIYLGNAEGTVFYDAIPNFGEFTISPKSITGQHELGKKHNTFVHVPCKWTINT